QDLGSVVNQSIAAQTDSSSQANSAAKSDSTGIVGLRKQLEELGGMAWLGFVGPEVRNRPTLKGGYDSGQSNYGPYFDINVPLLVAGGFSTTSSYHRESLEEPATQQKKVGREIHSSWKRPMSDWGSFNLDFRRRSNETNRVGFAKSTSENTNLSSSLTGTADLGDTGIDGKWAVKGNIKDDKVTSGSRAGATNQTLNTGTFSLGTGRKVGGMNVALNAGLDVSAGPQTLSAATDGSNAQQDTKTSVSDTLGVNLRWQQGKNRSFSAQISRQVFNEDRLDYLKDFRGVSIFDPDTRLKIVGSESESRNITSVNLTATTPIYRSLRTNLGYNLQRKETHYTLSEQGFIPEHTQNFNGDVTFRYAQAGSLKVSLGLSQLWDDRRSRGSKELRGKHFSNSNSVSFTIDQHLLGATDLKVLYAEDLTQQVYDYKLETGTLDIDVLSKRVDARLSSDAFSKIKVTLTGTYKTAANVFLDAKQVANNNRDQNTWKVSGDYAWQLTQAVSFSQSYQLGIDYTDYYYSYVPEVNQRDKFYKRTQLKTDLNLKLPGAASFGLSHSVDRTRGGNKLLQDDVEASGYTDDLARRQDEQRLNASVSFPLVLGYKVSVETNRTWRTLQGANDEFQGNIRAGVKGLQTFLNDRMTLSLDLGYVWAYGPPRVIRIERDRRYFTSSTYLSWAF
ncbi:MAG TPA: hypothetical protein VKA63_02970, partial [Candidatus Krumholzibacteria bacterium]|nr:hypothetical protein [Candidatus Krumholzibacteria bacterium]